MVVALAVIGVSATQRDSGATRHTQGLTAMAVSAIGISTQPAYEVQRSFVGRVEAARESAVGFELDGALSEVLVDEGQKVAHGQVLARLDTARLERRREELVAAVEQARARRTLADLTMRRLQKTAVADAGAVSGQALDDARLEHQRAEAVVAVAEAEIASVDVEIAKSELRAPYQSIVVRRVVDEGRVLAAGHPVVELMEQDRIELRVGVARRLLRGVEVGQTKEIDVAGERISATVKAILPVRGDSTRTIDVILAVDEAPGGLRPGDLVTITVSDLVQQRGYWLPMDALAEGARGLWAAYTLEPKPPTATGDRFSVVPRVVEVLHQDSDRVFVRGALPQDTLVIADGLHRVVPGQVVQVSTANEGR